MDRSLRSLHKTIKIIESDFASHPGFKHPLWEWISRGQFDLEMLKRFALLYYEHVKVFRLYLAGVMTIMPKEDFQIALARVLADEYGIPLQDCESQPSHPAMYRAFMCSLGLTEADWEQSHMIPGIEYYHDVHTALVRGALTCEAVGALIFGMERTTPYRHAKVLKGLEIYSKKSNALVDAVFFSSHVKIDPGHNQSLIDTVPEWFVDSSKIERLKLGARISFDARKVFLDDLTRSLGLAFSE